MQPMNAAFDVCIHGAGITGRTLALLLAREKLRVGLVRRPRPADQSDVRAYALNAASHALLESLRAWVAPEHACAVREMRVEGDDGGRLAFSAQQSDAPALNWIVDIEALQNRLDLAIQFQPLITVLSEPAPAELTVHCEGRAGREARTPASTEVFAYPQHAIACRVAAERAHESVARQWFRGQGSGSEILAFLPLGAAFGNSVALVWSVPVARADELLALPAADFERELMEASHGVLGTLTLQGERARWPLQRSTAAQWVGPGWALAGDAAHTVHPLSGQGLNLGLADVAGLAQTLAAREPWRRLGDERLLRRYERSRKAEMALVTWATDGLQGLFAHGDARVRALRNQGLSGFDRLGPLKTWAARQAMGRAV